MSRPHRPRLPETVAVALYGTTPTVGTGTPPWVIPIVPDPHVPAPDPTPAPDSGSTVDWVADRQWDADARTWVTTAITDRTAAQLRDLAAAEFLAGHDERATMLRDAADLIDRAVKLLTPG